MINKTMPHTAACHINGRPVCIYVIRTTLLNVLDKNQEEQLADAIFHQVTIPAG